MPSSVEQSDTAKTYAFILRNTVRRNLQKTDSAIVHLNRLLSTTDGFDRLLNLIYYLATFLAPQLSRAALRLTIKLPTPIPLIVLTPASSALTTAAHRLRTLAARISDFRMFLRLWGLVGMYSWGASTLRNPPTDPVLRGLVLAQVTVNTGFQVLENMAYLSKYDILAFNSRTEGRMWLWSTRCWAAHIVLEFMRLERVRSLGWKKKAGSEEEEETERTARRSWLKTWVCNAANAPLSMHWSLEKGLISDTAVGVFGSVAGVIGLRDAWKNCATA